MKLTSSILALCFSYTAQAQLSSTGFSFSCLKDTVVSCSSNCFTLKAKVPYISRNSSNYTVSKATCLNQDVLPGTPGNGALITVDDEYSPQVNLPFNFPFYNTYYNSLVVSGNATISFDITNATGFADWDLSNDLPSASYDRALIMGPFHDLDITSTTSVNRQIKYDVAGTKPHRKFVFSLNKVPDYVCTDSINNTSQIILYEGLGLVDVQVWDRQICNEWNSGKAMIGMQNYEKDKGIMAPGRAYSSPNWGGVPLNEQWRFAPKDGASLLKRVDLYKSTGEFVVRGDTVNDGNGNYTVTFPNVCPVNGHTLYVVQPVYYNVEYALSPGTWPVGNGDSLVYGKNIVDVLKEAPDAAQSVWTGAVNTAWENAGNWSCNSLPTSASAVIITSGTVVIHSNVTIKKLTVSPGVNLVVDPGYNLTILNP